MRDHCCVILSVLLYCSGTVRAQTPKVLWDTPSEVREWIHFPTSVVSAQDLSEGGRDFVRITRASFKSTSEFPGIVRVEGLEDENAPVLLDPQTHNTIRITMRQTFGFQNMKGFWIHRSARSSYELESFVNVPLFDAQPLRTDGDWQELTFSMTTTPFFIPDDDVISVLFHFFSTIPWDSLDEYKAAFDAAPPDAHWDIDKIEILQIDDPTLTQPQIADFNPKRGFRGSEVTITGSGFAEPASRNAVLFDTSPVEILCGDNTTLVVKAEQSGSSVITVLTPGGGKAVASEPFVTFAGSPSTLLIVAGDGQSSPVGSTLSAFRVRLVTVRREGIADQPINFQVTSGSGSLLILDDTTDDQGFATTTLTLGSSPGTVTVEASWKGRLTAVFTVTATP